MSLYVITLQISSYKAFFFKFCHFLTAYHHQPAVETSGGAAGGEEPHKVTRKAGVRLTDLQFDSLPVPHQSNRILFAQTRMM